MARICPVDQSNIDTDTRNILGVVRKKMGLVPNFIATMANSPAVLKAYLGLSRSLSMGVLSSRLREQIALIVSETNSCRYCVAAHTALSIGTGLTEHEIIEARQGISHCDKETVALIFAKQVLENNGHVTDKQMLSLFKAGYSNGEICEIIANVTLNLLTNYINLTAETEMDFPTAPSLVIS